MGRYALAITFLGAVVALASAEAPINGNIGCLFSDTMCKPDEEWCYNDFAFGKCLPVYGKIDKQDLTKFKFGLRELQVLEKQIQRLFLLGYRWSHTYTQCVLQAVLDAIKDKSNFDISNCNRELDQDLEGALKAIEGQEMHEIDPDKMAVIHYSPSNKNPNTNFADEVYYPPAQEELVPSHHVDSNGNPKGPIKSVEYGPNKDEMSTINKIPNTIPKQPDSKFSNQILDEEDEGVFGDYPIDPSYQDVEDEILNPQDIIKERLAFPPGMPMSVYNDDPDYEPVKVSEKDYDYDLFFHSPYATPPKLSRMFKRKKPQKLDRPDGSMDFGYDPTRPISLRTLANLLRAENDESIPDGPNDSDDGTSLYDKRFPESNIGFFRETPKYEPFWLDKEQREPVFGVYKPYDSRYENRILYPPRSELPELEPPKPEYDPNYSPDTLHPKYVKSDYDKPKVLENDPAEPPANGPARPHFSSNTKLSAYPKDMYYGIDYPAIYDYGFYPNYFDYDVPLPWNTTTDDVKKPGPSFKSNNDFAFSKYGPRNPWLSKMGPKGPHGMQESILKLKNKFGHQGLEGQGSMMLNKQIPDLLLTEEAYVDGARDASRLGFKPGFSKQGHNVLNNNKDRGKPPSPEERHSYVYITINGVFRSGRDAEQFVYIILRMMELNLENIQNLNVEKNQVMFQLKPNPKKITAEQLAENTEQLRDSIRTKLGIEITQAGVGTKNAISAVVFSSSKRKMLAVAAIICGVCTALLVAAIALFLLRRHARSKAKLQGINSRDTEASKDYQDLCRARMSGKNDSKNSSGRSLVSRVSGITKDCEGGNKSPSSRNEEPVVSNMDISTGHMVLSYMEDHLKNKDRLEQEWIALCAYEAEPCATDVGWMPEHIKKNRYPDNLPYDHNRVILNVHTNINGANYINASSITDHDPRNPAYIATQGALEGTTADFWQLVWEQGSVVIVMLTRLTENGQSLCHRYWPEEGSEMYHIYEVHLVSEHIWCDDYLVRSFYLKNVRTGETRTVTQFHFMSWPESGIPASTKALLEFRRKVNKSYRGRSCPIIVHCSDGIGRTGTYCLIDMVLNRMSKGTKEIDIAATLEHIRDQRPNMVKTKNQFEFVLMSVAEEVHAILKALPQ